MDQKRFILFIASSLAILMLWNGLVMPRFFPPPKPAAKAPEKPGESDDAPAIAEIPGQELPEAEEPARPAAKPAVAGKAPKFPHEEVTLGSLDPNTGYFLEATLTTQGAALSTVRLNDPRYRELDRPKEQLRILNEVRVPLAGDPERPFGPSQFRTFQMAVDEFDRQLEPHKTCVDALEWEIDPKERSESSVTFRMPSVDGSLELVKRYTLQKPPVPQGVEPSQFREVNATGYEIRVELTVRNTGDKKQAVAYMLQGPVGVPLENAKNTRKFRDLRMGFIAPSGGVKSSIKTAQQIAKDEAKKGQQEEWTTPIRYIGVDMQFFAALMAPQGDQVKEPYLALIRPQLVEKEKEEAQSEISVRLNSIPLEIEPGKSVTHEWTLYAGPKREALLESVGAGEIVDFGFASLIARGMLKLLNFFHGLGLPYALSIVCLTILVRGCLFPISKKQAVSAKKMKDLQPKIAELKKKHGDDKEKFTRAQLELFSKHNYNPLSGCLPMLLQLPIFIGLYNSLSTAVDLRMAPFLYMKNLAAPDAAFQLPFNIPFLGTNEFNILPIITIVLFIVQQKMFMPPPTDEQQAMQMKMMNYMMIFMGFMFYKVPAGLCIYFIASSLWGLGERKLLDLMMKNAPTSIVPDDDGAGKSKSAPTPAPPPRENFWTKMLAQADAAANQAQQNRGGSNGTPPDDDGRKDKKKSKNRR